MRGLFWIPLVAAVSLLLDTAPASAQWVAARSGSIPGATGPTGREADGRSLRVCRARHERGLHPGKIRPGFGACFFGWGSNQHRSTVYDVLVGGKYRWVRARHGRVPDFAIVAGRESDGRSLFVCRAQHRGGVHPGKVRSGFRGCNIEWGGGEHAIPVYEVLVSAWQQEGSSAPPMGKAEIRLGARCGVADSGQIAHVVNLRRDRRVRVTVRQTWKDGTTEHSQKDFVYTLAAGGQQRLGCYRLLSATEGRIYSLVGIEGL